jgi:hypothetical protein
MYLLIIGLIFGYIFSLCGIFTKYRRSLTFLYVAFLLMASLLADYYGLRQHYIYVFTYSFISGILINNIL